MSSGREMMRVSDAERQAAAERLRLALADGRLDFVEYDDRLAKAFQAVTYADLERLFSDLPASGAPVLPVVAPQSVPAHTVPGRSGPTGLPLPLKIMWTIWSVAMLVNLTVWLLVSIGNGGPDYFWPMWLFVPGAALAGATVMVQAVRSHQ
jgi:hypothetical protein